MEQIAPDSLEITDSNYPLSGCDDGVAATEKVDEISPFKPPVVSCSTFIDGEEPDEKAEVSTMKDEKEIPENNEKPFLPSSCVTSSTSIRHVANTVQTSVESLEEGIVFGVFPQNPCQELMESTVPTEVEVGGKELIDGTEPPQNPGNVEEYAQAIVTVEELAELELQDCTESNNGVEAESSEHPPKSVFVPAALCFLLAFCTNTELRTAILLPLISFVTAVGIQGHCSDQVKWSLPSP